MSLHDLPSELLVEIAKCLLNHEALARFAQTSRRLFVISTPILLDNSKSWVGRYGMTVLHWAAENGRTALIEQLLERKVVDIENTDGRVWTALHYSAASGHIETTRTLLANGANPAAHTPEQPRLLFLELYRYQTPLHHAASKGHNGVVRLLLESGVDIDDFGGDSGTPLQLATKNAHHDTVRLLLDLGARMQPVPENPTLLHMAMVRGHNMVLEALLEKSVASDINSPYLGSTLLHTAIRSKVSHACIPSLLAHGANTTTVDDQGYMPLHLAALSGFTQVIEWLLNSGADIAARDSSVDATALHWAVLNHHEPVIKLLLQQGADATIKDKIGRTAADWANGERNSVIKLLLQQGADATIKDRMGRTAADWANGEHNFLTH